jgi:hypothetical protein
MICYGVLEYLQIKKGQLPEPSFTLVVKFHVPGIVEEFERSIRRVSLL